MTYPDRAAIAACAVAVLELIASATSASAAGPLAGQVVVVDPGHGGFQPGAIALGVEEKTLTLPIGLDLGASLERAGARVVYTRSTDVAVSLQARAALANSVHADAFVALHANTAPDPSIRGVTTFYGAAVGYADGAARPPDLVRSSRRLAGDVQRSVVESTQEVDRGVRSSAAYVLGHADVPAVLIETGFMTNPEEERRLASAEFQDQLAQAISHGVVTYLDTELAPGARATEASTPSELVATARVAGRVSVPTPPAAPGPARAGTLALALTPPATTPRQTQPSLARVAVGVIGGALALSLLGLRHQRVNRRRKRRMLRRRRARRDLLREADG